MRRACHSERRAKNLLAGCGRVGLLLSAILASVLSTPPAAAAVTGPFDGWWLNGVAVTSDGASLSPGSAFTCSPDDVDGLQPSYDPASGLCQASDTVPKYAG